MEGVEINMSKLKHKENSSKEKFDKEKAEFEKTNEKCVSNEVNIASQDLQFSKTTPDNNNKAGRKPENKEYRKCKSGTSKEHKRKFESEEENNQTWRVGSYRQGKKVSKRAEFTNRRNRRQYSRKSSAETYSTIARRRISEELQNNRDQGKDKEIIVESSKKVLSKEDWSMEKNLIHKKNDSSLAGIIDMSITTKSDHNIITTYLNLSHLITNSGTAIVKRKAIKRTVFLYEEVKKEDWEQFKVELDRILKNKKAFGLCEKQLIHGNEQDYLNEIWGIIERAIIEAANKSLPKKKVSNFRHTKAKEFNRTYMHRPILQISRWMRFIRDRLGFPIEETDKLEFNLTTEKINTDLQLEIQQAEDIWTEDTLVDLKSW
ncbi:28619_t:CDS:2 [Gigaspora margarita]|uniref:28619_t:CDS:1 n=1 Tax=Gigaspora margarita TaxID=4874 RepID=A0ABN7V5C9_GIGMA|nr:28619_t:CDS:2 [Gigaspora margarita]